MCSICLVLLLIAVNFVFLLTIILTRLLFAKINFCNEFLLRISVQKLMLYEGCKTFLVEIYIIVPSKKHKISLDIILSTKNCIILFITTTRIENTDDHFLKYMEYVERPRPNSFRNTSTLKNSFLEPGRYIYNKLLIFGHLQK